MPEKIKHKEISRCELNKLIERIEHAIKFDLSLSSADLKLLLSAITTLCKLQERIEEDNTTLHKLRKLLGLVTKSESRKKSSGGKKSSGNKNKLQNKDPGFNHKKTKRDQKPPEVKHHKIEDHKKGDICPECQKGKLYKYYPGELLRISGHAPFTTTKHVTERFRCNGCQIIYKANLPYEVLADGLEDQKYGYSARTVMVLNKFYTGTAYNHQENLSDIMGCSISSSTIYDQCQQVSYSVEAIVEELYKEAANAKQFDIDDTHNKILTQEAEYKDRRNGNGKQLRTGVYTSGLIATLTDVPATTENIEIILFETSLGHAGEHLDKVLNDRDKNLEPPIVMSDALSSNSSIYKTNKSFCNAHCRRMFFDIESNYPKEIEWVLEKYSKIWLNEKNVKQKSYSPEKRLEYHKKYSLPVMEELKSWAQIKYESKDFEEYSSFGKAIKYLLRHYDNLCKFCHVPRAKIDNNRMEERLKLVIRGRKNSYFYKTPGGADVANKLISVIATADASGINLFDYITDLQRYRVEVKKNPKAWLPWNYVNTISEKLKPDKAA